MMSSYFYPAPNGGEAYANRGDDWRTQPSEDPRPRQLSLLDWMLQPTAVEPHVTNTKND